MNMYEQELTRFSTFQLAVALMLFWVAVAHPARIRRMWAFYASAAMMIVSYASPVACTSWSRPTIRWLTLVPLIFITLSLILAFVAVALRRDRTPPRLTS
jgi:hypothetical protein